MSSVPSHHRYNVILAHTPSFLHPSLSKVLYNPAGLLRPPPVVQGLRSAPSPGSWSVPILSRPTYSLVAVNQGRLKQTIASPAILFLHIFSTSTSASRLRRHLIRRHSPLASIPQSHQHLVEVRFVLGLQRDGEYDVEEEMCIVEEMEEYGDMIRLKELEGGGNMNRGKSWEWLRYVGREHGREVWWVIKCDDDTLPILPNLLPWLLKHDPSKPTYLGTSMGRWPGFHFYFEGMMYGFSWGVVKTMAVANVSREERNTEMDEDARMGELMVSLPLAPTVNTSLARYKECDFTSNVEPDIIWSLPPPSPDPCTGLVRLDLSTRLGYWRTGRTSDAFTAVGWHGLKSDEAYIAAYDEAMQSFASRNRAYIWDVPPRLDSVADSDVSNFRLRRSNSEY